MKFVCRAAPPSAGHDGVPVVELTNEQTPLSLRTYEPGWFPEGARVRIEVGAPVFICGGW
jgi:hypothetical protein